MEAALFPLKRTVPADLRGGTMAGWTCALLLLSVLLAPWKPVSGGQLSGLTFERSPGTVISSLGKPVQMDCKLKGAGGEEEPPSVVWLRDGVPLEFADTNQFQLPTDSNSWIVISTLSIKKVQLPDMGSYRCAVQSKGNQTLSEEGRIQLEGLPHFSVEPHHRSTVANVSLSLRCVAHGPPEPVKIIWLQDGAPLNSLGDPVALSPSTLNLTGLNRTSSFSCEAHNQKGVATSGSGTITVLPSPPHSVAAVEIAQTALRLSWQPGFGGVYPIIRCSVQARQLGDSFASDSDKTVHDQKVNIPPATHLIQDLEPHTLYAVRVACASSQGPSDWSPWVELRTQEGVPENPPANVTAKPNGTEVLVTWEEPAGKLNGELQGYMVEYSTPSTQQVDVDAGLNTEFSINLTSPLSNVSFRVCAYTGAGRGPWTPVQTLVLNYPETEKLRGGSGPAAFSWHWWYVVMAVTGSVALAVLLAVYVAKLRRKETRFGEAFEPMMERGELVVRYRARRSYSRRPLEATLNSLGISDELKQKLQDVMVDRHKLTLGKTLGEGEFGSVMEGLLNQEEALLKVAVKTMKIAICTRSEMEDFLREAACMKEFDHPNVMRLLGVCLQTVESEGYPSPVVILPYMKHGDLHSYLLYSRLGDCPVYLPSHMLVKFMADIARGMEYLSSKNFIHRDLAARNCMLNENMNVCVADFGLSKKIYNGDYYRQGRISKMPVKWIAIESLADRVYTTKSDVWSFGVTMWEIATRGQTPYPGVENSEIYDYLRQGNRLKQPPDCLDCIYSLMFSCWLLSPKDRPSFETLCCELEKALEDLPDPQDPEEILYVNMDESSTELGAVGGRDPVGSSPLCLKGLESVTTAEVHDRYVPCPQLETARTLCDSLESLDMPVSSSTATLPLQPSCRTTPTPTFELLEDREAARRMPWQ
ncbi:tyrosine-protein kinase receptor UFO [Fundulus heteroclitus]|uniref:tyrosine-protein kinase receptor UFO n=1 Tax=Fundulus heteroclitus TaxID=8078 RepID=UPI00165C54BC|nr:tyrosine-protein kinase receptor UFO [Fundulus heteroclitus]XP_036005782.1 tyrosine-protein kinase receptor UFO [Fundulus heteroclitus]